MIEILLSMILISLGYACYLLLNVCNNLVQIYKIICVINNRMQNGGRIL
jgi:hypothetical protein